MTLGKTQVCEWVPGKSKLHMLWPHTRHVIKNITSHPVMSNPVYVILTNKGLGHTKLWKGSIIMLWQIIASTIKLSKVDLQFVKLIELHRLQWLILCRLIWQLFRGKLLTNKLVGELWCLFCPGIVHIPRRTFTLLIQNLFIQSSSQSKRYNIIKIQLSKSYRP